MRLGPIPLVTVITSLVPSLDYFLMQENTGVSLENIISQVVAKNVDALEVHLFKSKKVLKEASKTQTKLLTQVVKQKLALDKGHSTEVAHEEAARALRQTTKQLDRARGHCCQTHRGHHSY